MDSLAPGPEPANGGGFLGHLVRALPVMLTISVLVFAIEKTHVVEPFNTLALDLMFATTAHVDARHVVIVTINDDDYREMFQARSPLDPEALGRLVAAILQGSPAAVGVDVLTETPAPSLLRLDDQRIVWLQDAWSEAPDGSEGEPWVLGPVLGVEAHDSRMPTALGQFPLDASGMVRRYYRSRELHLAAGPVTRPSLAWALVQTYCTVSVRDGCDRVATAESVEPMRFNFAGDRYSFRKISAGALEQMAEQIPALSREFKDKIVLIGGTFRAGRDEYRTPVGRVSGLDLTAFAIESELAGGGIEDVGLITMLLLDLASGIALLWLNWRWPPVSAAGTAMNIVAIVLLTLNVSYFSFWSFEHWVSFVPVGLGIWLHELYHRARAHHHARQRLTLYQQRYGPL